MRLDQQSSVISNAIIMSERCYPIKRDFAQSLIAANAIKHNNIEGGNERLYDNERDYQ
jgi:hypothetical protein